MLVYSPEFINRAKNFGIKGDLIHSISWIEILLQTPIEDYRKNAIGLILAPYLINIRKFSTNGVCINQGLVKEMQPGTNLRLQL